jgi:serine/threonine-protein kinase
VTIAKREIGSLERLGRYLLVDRISSGGMAEVWRARVTGIRGFSKTVAIKRLHPHLLEKPRFLRMFTDEAKIASRLSHPNIVQIYDLGEVNRLPYIAMEYVAGRDLYEVMERLAARRVRLPWPLASRIALELLAGLEHAHGFRSLDGLPQEIVHRDVSPRNVLLAWSGDVKLTDFGVARARDREEHTEHGVIKGKVRYLSPEAARGRPVDRRSDLFSLGVVIAEMLTMAPLREGASDMEVLLAVREGRLDTSRFEPLPTGLRSVLETVLDNDPDRRPADAAELREQLAHVATGEASPMTPAQVGRFMRSLFEAEMASDEERELEIDRALADAQVTATRDADTAAPPPGPHPLNVVSGKLARRVGPITLAHEEPAPRPTSSGDLRQKSVVRLFHELSTCDGPVGVRFLRLPLRKAVYFEHGHPVYVESNLEGELFGERMVARGELSRRRHAAILDHAARHGLRFTEALLAIEELPPHELFRNLAEQVRERILDLFSWIDGTWERIDGLAPPEAGMPLNVRTHTLIHEGVQDRLPLIVVRQRVEELRPHPLRLVADDLPSDLQLSGRQQRLLRHLAASPTTFDEIVRAERDEERILRLVYMLAEIGHLETA